MKAAAENGYKPITGIVEQVSRKGKRTAIMIEGFWYSTFDQVPGVGEGDSVSLTYSATEKDGRVYRNIEELEVQASKQAERAAHIDRSVALKAAAILAAAPHATDPRKVMALAGAFSVFLETGQFPQEVEGWGEVPF